MAESIELVKEIAKVLDEKKAIDIKAIETTEVTIVSDYFIIASGTSNTHTKSLADEVEYEIKKRMDIDPEHIEGRATGWILLDYGWVIVHIFEKVGVDVAISTNNAIMNELKNKIIEKSSNILLTVEQNQGEVIEAKVPKKFFDKELKDIHFPVKAIIGIIKRGKKIIIPNGHNLLRENDTMIIFTKSTDVQKVKEFI